MTDLARTYATHREHLVDLATRVLAGDRDAAEDAVHTVVVRQLAGAQPLTSTAGWQRAVQNMAVDRIRADNRQRDTRRWVTEQPMVDHDHADQVCTTVDAAAAAPTVRAAVDALPARLRTVVHLRYVADLSNDAVAARLGMDKSRASRLHTQALAALRDHLTDPTTEHPR